MFVSDVEQKKKDAGLPSFHKVAYGFVLWAIQKLSGCIREMGKGIR